eukprot:Lankesteria_metandrocarpae@DN4625_c0_g1_i1.p1
MTRGKTFLCQALIEVLAMTLCCSGGPPNQSTDTDIPYVQPVYTTLFPPSTDINIPYVQQSTDINITSGQPVYTTLFPPQSTDINIPYVQPVPGYGTPHFYSEASSSHPDDVYVQNYVHMQGDPSFRGLSDFYYPEASHQPHDQQHQQNVPHHGQYSDYLHGTTTNDQPVKDMGRVS